MINITAQAERLEKKGITLHAEGTIFLLRHNGAAREIPFKTFTLDVLKQAEKTLTEDIAKR